VGGILPNVYPTAPPFIDLLLFNANSAIVQLYHGEITLIVNEDERLGLICFRVFRGEDLEVMFYQNMPNLHSRYKSTEINISQKNTEYLLNYSPSSGGVRSSDRLSVVPRQLSHLNLVL
jgi:hypothetical protein